MLSYHLEPGSIENRSINIIVLHSTESLDDIRRNSSWILSHCVGLVSNGKIRKFWIQQNLKQNETVPFVSLVSLDEKQSYFFSLWPTRSLREEGILRKLVENKTLRMEQKSAELWTYQTYSHFRSGSLWVMRTHTLSTHGRLRPRI